RPRRDEPDRRWRARRRRPPFASAGNRCRGARGNRRRQHRLPDRPARVAPPARASRPLADAETGGDRARRGGLPASWLGPGSPWTMDPAAARLRLLARGGEPHAVAAVPALERARRGRLGGDHGLTLLSRRPQRLRLGRLHRPRRRGDRRRRLRYPARPPPTTRTGATKREGARWLSRLVACVS